MRTFLSVIFAMIVFFAPLGSASAEVPPGGKLADVKLIDQGGRRFALSSLYGKPLVVSFIYTSCVHTCGTLTASLKGIFASPGSDFGTGFTSVTIGFDTERDTPEALGNYGRQFTDDFSSWRFASSDREAMEKLIKEAGFAYTKSDSGFDHPNMAVVIGPDGKRIYGTEIDRTALLDAVAQSRDLESPSYGAAPSGLIGFLKSICYTYDPRTGTYRPDYSMFAMIGLGFLFWSSLMATAVYVVRKARKSGDI